MPRGRPTPPVIISDADRDILERWERPKSAQALAMRTRIVFACEIGLTNTEVAELLGVSMPTVTKWRSRFIRYGPDGLTDEPRPGAPRTISDEDVERVITLTLETTPEDATHWSTRSMAKKSGMTQSAVSRIWRAFALQPSV